MVRAPAEPPELPADVALSTMRRRHVRDVLGIERAVYPRPWSAALFFSELAQRSSRAYLVAHEGRTLVGYGGLMSHLDEGHITTLAVHPDFQHRKIGTRLLLALVDEARRRPVRSLALEVRVANWPAQRLYAWFGFRPVGVRKNYYAETGEDALVMWIDDLKSSDVDARLERVRAALGAAR
jgi:ribosomal-protein-alanine N-acetyltransferase